MNGKLLLLTAATLALAGGAQGQPLDLSLPQSVATAAAIPLAGGPARAVPDLANPLDPLARPTLQTNALDTAVFGRTALDRKFASNDRLSGSVGFLCGLQPGHNDTGAGAAYGADPHGRFVGAKFSIAFK